jgi:5-methylcytosine-specific restriction endonuclease McrA
MTTVSERKAELKALIHADERERCETGLTQAHRAELEELNASCQHLICDNTVTGLYLVSACSACGDPIQSTNDTFNAFTARLNKAEAFANHFVDCNRCHRDIADCDMGRALGLYWREAQEASLKK